MHKPQYINSLNSPRFSGIKTFMRLPYTNDLANIDFAIMGIPFDTGSSFATGSRFGPQSIREASSILKPYHPVLDVHTQEYCSGIDYGDLPVIPGYITETYAAIEQALQPVVDENVIPICLGGDHSITLPELRVIAQKYGPVALIHFDSHSDTTDLFFGQPYNHGTTFRRAIEEGLILPEHTLQIGLRGPLYSADQFDFARSHGVEILSNWTIREDGFAKTIEKMKMKVAGHPVFVTFDIDFLDAAYAPGTGTPEICGFNTFEAQKLVLQGLRDANIVGFDLVEVLPAADSPGMITSYAAAGIVFDFISLIANRKKTVRREQT